MKFPYSSLIAAAPDSDDYVVFRRPELPVTIVGPAGWVTLIALADTGSDNTIFPKSVADYLRIPLQPMPGGSASVIGGQRVELLSGDVALRLEAEGAIVQWSTPVFFFDFSSPEEETVILGHAGFGLFPGSI